LKLNPKLNAKAEVELKLEPKILGNESARVCVSSGSCWIWKWLR